MSEHELFDIRSKIGMLFQESALFDSLNIEENVAYPLLNQTVDPMPAGPGSAARERGARIRGAWPARWKSFPASSPAACGAAPPSRAPWSPNRRCMLYDSPTAGLDPITAHTIMALLIKERDVSQATTLMVTHRYQDGNLMANFRYNSEQGASGAGA